MKALHTSILSFFLSLSNLSFEKASELTDEIYDSLEGLSIEQIIWEIADYFMNYTSDSNAWIQARKLVLDIIGNYPTPNADATIMRLQKREANRIAA